MKGNSFLSIQKDNNKGKNKFKSIKEKLIYPMSPNAFIEEKRFILIIQLIYFNSIWGNDDYNVCFLNFNPEDKSDYQFTVHNWTKAIFLTLHLVSEKESRQSS